MMTVTPPTGGARAWRLDGGLVDAAAAAGLAISAAGTLVEVSRDRRVIVSLPGFVVWSAPGAIHAVLDVVAVAGRWDSRRVPDSPAGIRITDTRRNNQGNA